MNGSKKKGAKGKATLASVAPAKAIDSAIDLETVRELARIIAEFGLTEIEADPAGHVRVRRELGGGAVGQTSLVAPPAITLAPTPTADAGGGAVETGQFVTSPFVGTFYRAPSPEAAVFVEVGASVRKGQVVCIVEAMKLMNEIESEADGKVVEILVKNGEHVEYGQKLIRLA